MTEAELNSFRLAVGEAPTAEGGTGEGTPLPVPPGGLPRIVNATVLEPLQGFRRPEEIIEGLLHTGSKMTISGPSKAKKTWLFHDLAISVATGRQFLGRDCTQGKVLLIDLELQVNFLYDRLHCVAGGKGVEWDQLENLDILSLRGQMVNLERLANHILWHGQEYELMIIDPLYRLLAGMDENTAREVTVVCAQLESLAHRSGAAIVIGQHFAKGNASNKSSIDRIAGSGVYARDADSIVTLTPAEGDGQRFIAEFTLRNFAPIEPVVLEWIYPLYVPNPDIAPFIRTTARESRPFPSDQVADEILEILVQGPAAKTQLIRRFQDRRYPRDKVRDVVEKLDRDGEVVLSGRSPVMVSLPAEATTVEAS